MIITTIGYVTKKNKDNRFFFFFFFALNIFGSITSDDSQADRSKEIILIDG